MKIFSELIIDSYFRNSKYCTCSIFRMISASIFSIVILHHVPCKTWLDWAPPTFSTRGCLWKSSILAISTRFLDFSNTDFSNMPCWQQHFDPNGFLPIWKDIQVGSRSRLKPQPPSLPSLNVFQSKHFFWKAYHWRLQWEQRHVSKSYVYYDVYIYIYKYTHNLYVYIKILQCTYNIVPRCGSQVVDVPACTMATVPQSPWSWHTASNHMAARCSHIS